MKHPPATTARAEAPELELTVESLGGLGDGIASHEGLPVFIPKVLPGEKIRVRITNRTKENIRAELVEVITPSPQRRAAPCIHYEQCGGCTLQHMQPDDYHAFKLRRVHDAIRLAGFPDTSIDAALYIAPESRRRADFKVIYTPTGVSLAYLGLRSHERIEISDCKILSPALRDASEGFISSFSTLPRAALLQSLQLTEASNGVDAVVGVSTLLMGDAQAKLVETVPAGCIRLSATDGRTTRTLWQKEEPVLKLPRAEVPLAPESFLQASAQAQDAITALVVQWLQGARRVADIFAGLGVYAFSLPQNTHVTAFEGEKLMVEAITQAAQKAGIAKDIKAVRRDLFTRPLSAAELEAFDAVVINPPRTGAKAQCEQIAASGLKKVAMVSCNPATFARDAKTLREAGFSLQKIVPIDQFTWTAHLEIAAFFTKV